MEGTSIEQHHLSSPQPQISERQWPRSLRLTSLGDAMRQSEEWIPTSLPVPETGGAASNFASLDSIENDLIHDDG